jgi:anti-sigma B factor antagonist
MVNFCKEEMTDNHSLDIETAHSALGVPVVRLRGALTLRTLYEAKRAALQDMSRPVIVDLSAVPYMDSAGLGALISIYTSSQRTSRGFAMVGLSDRVRSLFQITRVEKLLPIFDTIPEAEVAVVRR